MVLGADSIRMRDYNEAPSTFLEGPPIAIKFSEEVSNLFHLEVQRLANCSTICRVIGARPNRGLLRDMLQARLQVQVVHVQMLGQGFYHVEFLEASSVKLVMHNNPVDMRGSLAFFSQWTQGFSPKEECKSGQMLGPVTMVMPGLRKEYLPFIEEIGKQVGIVVKKGKEQQDVKSNTSGSPSIRILLTSLERLPKVVVLPRWDGGVMDQRVEFIGLPDQCYYCKQIGHYLQDCQKCKNKQLSEASRQEQRLGKGASNLEVGTGRKTMVDNKEEDTWILAKGKYKLKQGLNEQRPLYQGEPIGLHNAYSILQDVNGDRSYKVDQVGSSHSNIIKEKVSFEDDSKGKGKMLEDNMTHYAENQTEMERKDITWPIVRDANVNSEKPYFNIKPKIQSTIFVAPEVVAFNSSRQEHKKKRSFKARGDQVKGEMISLQPKVISTKISNLDVNNTVME